jgi:predicted Ser/Thr protein kinase
MRLDAPTDAPAADTTELARQLQTIARSELWLTDPQVAPFATDSSHSEFFTVADGENLLLAKVIRDDYLSASPRTVLHEYAVMELAHRAALAPKPLYADLDRRLLIQEFVPGELLGEWSDTNITTCARLGARLMRVETDAAGLCSSHLDFDHDIAAHTATLRALRPVGGRAQELRSELLGLAESAGSFCRGAQASLDVLPIVLSHNDLSPENVILSPRAQVIIDFETAALSRPEFLAGQMAVDAAIDDALHGVPVRPFPQLWALALEELPFEVTVQSCRARVVERLLQNAAYGLRQAVRFDGGSDGPGPGPGLDPDLGGYAAKKLAVADFCRSRLVHCLGSW